MRRREKGWTVRIGRLLSGSRIALSTELYLDRKATLSMGRGSAVRSHGSILVEGRGHIGIGHSTTIMQGCEIVVADGASLHIGSSVYVGAYCNIRCAGRVTVGDHVRLAQFVSIIDGNYRFRDRRSAIAEADATFVTIHRGAWVGAQVVLLPEVEIGEGAVVGAGSVVTKSVPAFAVAAGNPARVLSYRE